MSEFKHITVEQISDKLADYVVADIRDEASFNAGHIAGAVPLNNGNLADFMQAHEYDQPIIVCCYHGISSQQAAAYIASQGFEDVYSLDGGYEAWRSLEASKN